MEGIGDGLAGPVSRPRAVPFPLSYIFIII